MRIISKVMDIMEYVSDYIWGQLDCRIALTEWEKKEWVHYSHYATL